MIIAALVCLIVAILALTVGKCFVKSKSTSVLFSLLIIIVLICFGIVCASYSNNFAGYSVFLIVSPLPLLLTRFSFDTIEKIEPESQEEETKTAKENSVTENEAENFSGNSENDNLQNAEQLNSDLAVSSVQTEQQKPVKKSEKNKKFDANLFAERATLVIQGCGYLMTAICVFFCSLHIGKESFYGVLAGIALGLCLAFLFMAIKKIHTFDGFLSCVFSCLSIGLCFSGIITALIYSFSITNILFSLGMLVLIAYFANFAKPNRFTHIFLVCAYLVLFSTILF